MTQPAAVPAIRATGLRKTFRSTIGGWLPVGGRDPLGLPIANVAVWTVIFTALAVWGMRRGQERV